MGNSVTHGWIPSNKAKVGKRILLKNEIWTISEVWGYTDKENLKLLSNQSRKTREVSDI